MTEDDEESFEPVFRDGKVHVLSEKCTTCIFRPGNLMSLNPGRVKDMVDACEADEGHIPCHATLSYGEHPDVGPAICRGFYDRDQAGRRRSLAIRFGTSLGIIEFVEPPELS